MPAKITGRTPSHLWYFGQRCWLLDDLTDFFGYNTKLPLHMGRAERAAIFLTVTDWVLGLGPPADAGSWVLGLQGTLGLGSWGQAPRPVLGVNSHRETSPTQDQPVGPCKARLAQRESSYYKAHKLFERSAGSFKMLLLKNCIHTLQNLHAHAL